MRLVIAILAAGEGKRMKAEADFPKALHTLANKSLLEHVLSAAASLTSAPVFIVCGYGKKLLLSQLGQKLNNIHWVEQPKQLGTADAVRQLMPYLSDSDR
jgi:bifunctional UDP-N-acetylglucosamine pyrophosphorylase / glucosamine-1-phosphate N-acetyltransferase